MGFHLWREMGLLRLILWILLLLFLVFRFVLLAFIFGCCILPAWVLELPIHPCSVQLRVSISTPGLSRFQFPARWRRHWQTIWMYPVFMCHSACVSSAGVLSRPGVPIQATWYILGHLVELVQYYNSQPNSQQHSTAWNACELDFTSSHSKLDKIQHLSLSHDCSRTLELSFYSWYSFVPCWLSGQSSKSSPPANYKHLLTAHHPISLLRRSCGAHSLSSQVTLSPQSSSSVWQIQSYSAASWSPPDYSSINHLLSFSKMRRNWPIEVLRLGFVCSLLFELRSSYCLLREMLLVCLLMTPWIRRWHGWWGCSSRRSSPGKVPDVLCSNFSLHLP